MVRFWHILLFTLSLQPISVFGQEVIWSNDNFKSITVIATDSLQLSKPIIPDKIKVTINNNTVSETFYHINYDTGMIYFDQSLIGVSLQLTYYIYPKKTYPKTYYAKDSSLIITPNEIPKFFNFEDDKIIKTNKNLFDGLVSKGSLVRGITFGNNQGGAVQSSLDLQLSGKLSDDVNIKAVISDHSVPIQSDGYTQQLNEFDKVYIELYNEGVENNFKIKAGHLDLNQRNDFFGNYQRKVLGVQVSANVKHGNAETIADAAISFSRGDFFSTKIIAKDGNQGPYKLPGKNGELFVIIISGSEHIYLDGILLQRGLENDYIINYNTGELTFTNKRIISASNRITADYIYSNQNYSRFLFYGGIEHKTERFKLATHFYSEKDNENSPINQNLNAVDIASLKNAGNDTSLMVGRSEIQTIYDQNKVLYKKDSLGNYVYATTATDVLYLVMFSYVGGNKGNYSQTNLGTNGRVFEYKSPINGVPQGDYEPMKRLVAPQKLQLYTLNCTYKLANNTTIGTDFGLSNKDLNLFSAIGDGNNIGLGTRFYAKREWKNADWVWRPQLEYSLVQKNFNPIEYVREIEFSRQYNLASNLVKTDQHFLTLSISGDYKDTSSFGYNLAYLKQTGQYVGVKNMVTAMHHTKKYNLAANAAFLTTDGLQETSTFINYKMNAERYFQHFTTGISVAGEQNKLRLKTNQLLDVTKSLSWNQFGVFGAIGDSLKRSLRLDYYHRADDSVRINKLTNVRISNGFRLQAKLVNNLKNRLSANFDYKLIDFTYDNLTKKNFLTGNIQFYKTIFNDGLVLNASYDLGSGTTPQQAFSYVKTIDAQGVYRWIDYNKNGIQEIDEFTVSEFVDQANYVRIYSNTARYIDINKNGVNLSVRIKPSQFFIQNIDLLHRINLQLALQTSNSFLKQGSSFNINPFEGNNLITKNENIRGIIYYNTLNVDNWTANYQIQHQVNLNYNYTGNDLRKLDSHQISVKYSPASYLIADFSLENSLTKSDSNLFSSKRYLLTSCFVEPKITYKPNKDFWVELNFQYKDKQNNMGVETLNWKRLGVALQWNDTKSIINADFGFVKNNFNGNENTLVANQMLEGLKTGNNMVWKLSAQKNLTDFLSLNIIYDGRKSENNIAIHTGNVQLKATF